jgi:hypothetical protein
MDFQTQHHPPVPFNSHATDATAPANQTRHDVAAARSRTPDARSKKRSPNYVHTQAASPAVISSLLDQLSAISIPAQDHFENLLVGYHDAPAASRHTSIHTASERNSLAGHDGGSAEHEPYSHAMREQNDAFPDDACEPPVIRTSKPPSGYSALTAPRKKDKAHSLGSYMRRNSGSSVSLQSAHSQLSVASIGNISIEAVVQRRPSCGSERSSAESKRSAKGHRSLMYMGSRERLRMKETERKRHAHGAEDVALHDSPRKAAVPLFSYEDTIKEEPASPDESSTLHAEPSRFAHRFPDRNASPRRLRLNLVDGPPRESPTDQGLIPERGSSLKHTGSPPRKSKKSRTNTAVRRESPEPAPKDPVPADEESARKDKILQELEQEENEVARRIRVLREQKLRRDILAGKQPMDANAGAAPPNVPRVSAAPRPEPSPTSTVSSASEVRVQSITKAHKVLGIDKDSFATDKPTEELAEKARIRQPGPMPMSLSVPEPRSSRHSRSRSLTVNDGDDLSHLPINYALALRSAEEASPPTPTLPSFRETYPPPPSISVTSSRETRSSATSPKRSSSAAVGGRSAVGRKATTSVLVGAPKEHRHSSSVTDGIMDTKAASLRSFGEEMGPRHQSLIMPSSSSASNSFQLQRNRTLSKKRWSHPDLPAKAEKSHNDKMERREAKVGAVQKAPQPVIEERPASLDSIDLEVESYLKSPRLSQKIRHPQTGRIISFSEVGDLNGFAVFVCVGMGLTRYVMAFYDQLAATLKLRLITPDRPGIGQSQVDPNGTPLSWPGE